jgi:sporulation protein YlmC with PRC-barrel domain
MNTQIRILFSALALALAAGAYTASHAQEQGTSGANQPQSAAPQAPATDSAVTPGSPATLAGAGDILNMKAGEIAGREVYNSQGKELGKVDMVARDRTTGDLSAIISVGGFLGFGGSKVALPIEQLTLQEDKLTASTALSKKELRQQASKYEDKKYEVVAEDTTLSQVAPTAGATAGAATSTPQAQGQAPSAAGAMSFQSLDGNSDGYITSDEVGSNQAIIGRWSDLDKNNDGRLDRAEFSAFEQSQEMRPSADSMRDRPDSSMGQPGAAAPAEPPPASPTQGQ